MKVFLSHPYADRMFARRLGDALRARGVEVTGSGDIAPGSSVRTEVQRRVDEADGLVVLLSEPRTNQWVDAEIAAAVAHNKPVIPLRTTRSAEIPPLIATRQYADVDPRRPDEAADVILRSLRAGLHPQDVDGEREQVRTESAYVQASSAEYERTSAASASRVGWIAAAAGLASSAVAAVVVSVLAEGSAVLYIFATVVVSAAVVALTAVIARWRGGER